MHSCTKGVCSGIIWAKNNLNWYIFVDFSKASDHLNHKKLGARVYVSDIRSILLNLVKSCLDFRKRKSSNINGQQFSLQMISLWVPQGSTLGSVLFNLYINGINNVATESNFFIFAANDSIFFQARNNAGEAELHSG